MQAIIKCESITNVEGFQSYWGDWGDSEYSFYCTDKNGNTLSSISGDYSTIVDWIENDILLEGVCDEGYEPPPTSTTTTTPKSTTTEYIPPSCDFLKFRDSDYLNNKIITV